MVNYYSGKMLLVICMSTIHQFDVFFFLSQAVVVKSDEEREAPMIYF